MSDVNTEISPMEVLLGKVALLIKAHAGGEVSGFTAENLRHAYMSLVEGTVDEETGQLLSKMVGNDWVESYEPSEDADEEADAIKHMAVTEVLQQIDETNTHDVVSTLASALMIACRELGWLEASRAAHDQWFMSEEKPRS